ncbi:MAG: hypothetical protein IJJ33_16900 [Victivallales bacterium]|nr:hypothetical protein [Victivallales bacterium]
MKHVILFITLLSMAILPAQEMECADGMCAIPSQQTASKAETSAVPDYIFSGSSSECVIQGATRMESNFRT